MSIKKDVKTTRMPLYYFLVGVEERLKNEVGLYFKLLHRAESKNENFPKCGFWAGIRLLMPVIDGLAHVYYPTDADKHILFIRNKLRYKYPYLIWEMFRHPLIHTEFVRSAKYKQAKVSWGVSRGVDHIFCHSQANLDVEKLYSDLLNFVKSELKDDSLKRKITDVEVSVIFTKIPREFEEEFESISKPCVRQPSNFSPFRL